MFRDLITRDLWLQKLELYKWNQLLINIELVVKVHQILMLLKKNRLTKQVCIKKEGRNASIEEEYKNLSLIKGRNLNKGKFWRLSKFWWGRQLRSQIHIQFITNSKLKMRLKSKNWQRLLVVQVIKSLKVIKVVAKNQLLTNLK